jgi:hypothetical protein
MLKNPSGCTILKADVLVQIEFAQNTQNQELLDHYYNRAQRTIKGKSQGIRCLLLIEAGRVGSIERIFEGLMGFLDCLLRVC